MLTTLLRHVAESKVATGTLVAHLPSGEILRAGDGNDPVVTIRIKDSDTIRRIIRDPDLGTGEAYMDGRLTIDGDDLHGFLQLIMANIRDQRVPGWRRPFEAARFAMRRIRQLNWAVRSRANVAHHYDLSGELYEMFLDEDR